MSVLVLIPAHNEERSIAAAVAGVLRQDIDLRLVVVTDNCTDRTAEIVGLLGIETFTPVGNTDKKAGALNQALTALLPTMSTHDYVLCADADTVMSEGWIHTAMQELNSRAEIGAIGGIFLGDAGGGLVGLLQRNEYRRYRSDILVRNGRAMVLTGTSTMFRVLVLRQLANSRGYELPGEPGQFYDTQALTEDNEITLAVKTLGWKCISPSACTVTTEVMLTWKTLYAQRLRWQRGALENLRAYGFTRTTLPYVIQQMMLAFSTVAICLFMVYTAIYLTYGTLHAGYAILPTKIGLVLTSIFILERLVTLRAAPWKARLVALPLVFEMIYDIFLQAIFVRAVIKIVRNAEAQWGFS